VKSAPHGALFVFDQYRQAYLNLLIQTANWSKSMIEVEVLNQIAATIENLAERAADIRGYL
jgi:hypothetical protein